MKYDMIHPVYAFKRGGYFDREYLAYFFCWSDACDYALRPEDFDGWEPRSLYMAPPKLPNELRRAA